MGGNKIFLDSRHVVLRTQYVEESVAFDEIKNVNFRSPDLLHNGCMTFVLADNVIPIYFLNKQTDFMLDCFGIIGALAKNTDAEFLPMRGKDGEKIGRFRCVNAGHPVLKSPFPMDCYLLKDSFRAECKWTDQGCTIPFSDFSSLSLLAESGEIIKEHIFWLDGNSLNAAEDDGRAPLVALKYAIDDQEYSLVFADKANHKLWYSLISVGKANLDVAEK